MYGSLTLDAKSKGELMKFVYDKGGIAHRLISGDHVTVWFKSQPDGFVAPDEEVILRVVGYAINDDVQAVQVEVTGCAVQNSIPHITVSHRGKPVLSGIAHYVPVVGPVLFAQYEEVDPAAPRLVPA